MTNGSADIACAYRPFAHAINTVQFGIGRAEFCEQ
jgi:hypothetical protein